MFCEKHKYIGLKGDTCPGCEKEVEDERRKTNQEDGKE